MGFLVDVDAAYPVDGIKVITVKRKVIGGVVTGGEMR